MWKYKAFMIIFLLSFFSLNHATASEKETIIIQTEDIKSILSTYDAELIDDISGKSIYQIAIDSDNILKLYAHIDNLQNIAPNKQMQFLKVKSTLENTEQENRLPSWSLKSMNFPSVFHSNREVIVAVLDTGLDTSHQDLSDKYIPGFNTISENALPFDYNGHGTHLTGIITLGLPDSIKVMPIKVLDDEGNGDIYSIVEGIYYAIEQGVHIINLSFGAPINNSLIEDAITEAINQGIVVVAASGNKGITPIYFPAGYNDVIAVGAHDEQGSVPYFSNYGSNLDFVAPGVQINSTYLSNTYKNLNGTSMATAFVSRASSALYLENPLLNRVNLIYNLQSTAVDLGVPGIDQYSGYGKINVTKAIQHSFDFDNSREINLYDLLVLSKKGHYDSSYSDYFGMILDN